VEPDQDRPTRHPEEEAVKAIKFWARMLLWLPVALAVVLVVCLCWDSIKEPEEA
jgi:hypothetical protein